MSASEHLDGGLLAFAAHGDVDVRIRGEVGPGVGLVLGRVGATVHRDARGARGLHPSRDLDALRVRPEVVREQVDRGATRVLLEAVLEPHPLAAEVVVLPDPTAVEDLAVRGDQREGERRDRIEGDRDHLWPHHAGPRLASALVGVVGIREAGEDLLADPVTLREGFVEPLDADPQEAGKLIALTDGDDAGVAQAADRGEELAFAEGEGAGRSPVALEGVPERHRVGDLAQCEQLRPGDGREPRAEVADELIAPWNGPHGDRRGDRGGVVEPGVEVCGRSHREPFRRALGPGRRSTRS